MQKTDHPENSFLGVPLKKNSQGGINKLNWYTFELKYWYTFQLIYTGNQKHFINSNRLDIVRLHW